MSTFQLSILLLFLILLSSNVFAFGLKPTLTRVDFSPGLEHQGQFVVTTNPEEVGAAKIVVEGDLAEYVDIAESVVLAGDETSIPYTLKLPTLLSPGEHVIKVLIEEDVPVEEEGITAKIRLTYKILVSVPLPAKHISVKLDVKQGKGILGITANVKNVGTLDVGQVTPQVTVTDPSGVDIGTVAMPSKSLNVAQSATFEDTLQTGELANGVYRATAAVAYDEGELEIAKEFAVGVPMASVTRKDTKFKANEVNDFTFDVTSEWNERLTGVVASVAVSKDNERLKTFASEPFDLAPRATEGVKTYFDAREIAPGTYDAVITLTYPEGVAQEPFTIEVFGAEDKPLPWTKIGLIALIAFNAIIATYVISQKMFKKPTVQDAASDALTRYVSRARNAGFTDAQIKEQLRKSGWTEPQIQRVGKLI